jgi:hypothetical protein
MYLRIIADRLLCDIDSLKKIQRRATKRVAGLRSISIRNCSIVVITFYLLRPHKLTNENQSQIQSV